MTVEIEHIETGVRASVLPSTVKRYTETLGWRVVDETDAPAAPIVEEEPEEAYVYDYDDSAALDEDDEVTDGFDN